MNEGATAPVQAALRRRLTGELASIGAEVAFGDANSVAWSSATFSGARHRLRFVGQVDGSRLDEHLETIDFAIPGHVVADIVATPAPGGFTVEALTIEAD